MVDISWLRQLISEYKLAQERLEQIKKKYDRSKIGTEIFKDLEKDLEAELRRAKDSKDTAMVTYWQEIIEGYLHKDRDIARITKNQLALSEADERLVLYYEKKLKIIKRLLGARLTQLLENYEEKNILMTEGHLLKSAQFLEEEEELERKAREKGKNGFTFDKM